MNPYDYKVSLRITHPTMDPSIITNTLGLKPSHSWKAGEPRETPNGENLDGINVQSYWTAQLTNGNNISSEKIQLESFLLDKNYLLKQHASFFSSIKESKGNIEYFIGIFGNKNMGCVFNSELLTSTNDLGIELSLDIYPYEE